MLVVLDQKQFSRFGEDKYKKAKEFGFDAVCYSMTNTETELYNLPEEESDKLLIAERERAAKEGLTFTHVHGPWTWPAPDGTPEGLKKKIENTKRSIHNARVLGAKYVVVHPFLPNFIVERDDEALAKDTYAKNLDAYNELLACAMENGIELCIENMPWHEFSLAKPSDIMRLCGEFDDKYIKTCLDIGHANVFYELKPRDYIKEMAPRLRVIHAHDNFYGVDMHLMPFCGNADWNEIFATLKEIDYQYIFELETGVPDTVDNEIATDVLNIFIHTVDYLRKEER